MKLISAIAALSVVALGGVSFFTNPTAEDYAQYASQTLTDEVQATLCEANGIPPLFESVNRAISGFCERTVGRFLSSDDIQNTLLANTERKDRLFFSTYTTTFPGRKYKTVGVFNRFYPYESSESNLAQEDPSPESLSPRSLSLRDSKESGQ